HGIQAILLFFPVGPRNFFPVLVRGIDQPHTLQRLFVLRERLFLIVRTSKWCDDSHDNYCYDVAHHGNALRLWNESEYSSRRHGVSRGSGAQFNSELWPFKYRAVSGLLPLLLLLLLAFLSSFLGALAVAGADFGLGNLRSRLERAHLAQAA